MTIAEIDRLSRERFVETLGFVFEDSPWVASQAWEHRPFGSIQALHAAMVAEVENATLEDQLELLMAHPDLGARARMSAASVGEQASAGLDQLTGDEFSELQDLNASYRDKFGFPFLYAVKGSPKDDILLALRIRLDADPDDEFHEALRQVYRIAWFRLESVCGG